MSDSATTALASACTLVLFEIWRTLLQVLSGLRRQIHVPAGDTAVVGSTAHQVPLYCQSLDCGFSPVESVTGMVVNVPGVLTGAACTGAVPESVNVWPAIGTNCQS